MTSPQISETAPLCVDLDGTLVSTDTLHEQLLLLLKTKPLALLAVLPALFKGIAVFKRAVSSQVRIRAEVLPYNEKLIAYLRLQAGKGRRILLVTAADQKIADDVARHIGLFETALASDGVTNLKSGAKVAAIREYLHNAPFEYVGDSRADVPVWKEAVAAILVNTSKRFRRILNSHGVPVTEEFPGRRANFSTLLRAVRAYQWSKNVLVFIPLFLSHSLFQADKLLAAVEAFAAICAAASAIYLLNDLFDLDADRKHPRKRHRPLASGDLSVRQGIVLSLALLLCAAVLASLLPVEARLFLCAYVLTSTLYSTILKQMLFIDVVVLAGLYTLRILYGGAATHTVISPWTLAFSIFIFISLAICKRLTELRHSAAPGDVPLPGRAYSQQDLATIASLGSSSGYVAALVMALYLNSPEVTTLYHRAPILWCICPMLIYWISRMLIIANRGNMNDDPIVFACRDRSSLIVGAAALLIVFAAL